MRRLAGADSLFLFNENRVRHQHTLKIAVVDPAGADTPVTVRRVARTDPRSAPAARTVPLAARARAVRPRPPVLGRAPPTSTSTITCGGSRSRRPAGARELAEVISRIASVGLERDRPLWQVWFVEGLADGQVAYVAKVHHSLADGVASARLLGAGVRGSARHHRRWAPVGHARRPNRYPARCAAARARRRATRRACSCASRRCWSTPRAAGATRAPSTHATRRDRRRGKPVQPARTPASTNRSPRIAGSRTRRSTSPTSSA